jgi:hypothetical protein
MIEWIKAFINTHPQAAPYAIALALATLYSLLRCFKL